MEFVEHIELGTLNPLLGAGSGYYGYEHYQPEPIDLQGRDHIRANSTNTDIVNCIIKKSGNPTSIDDDSRLKENILPIFSHDPWTAQETQTSLVTLNKV